RPARDRVPEFAGAPGDRVLVVASVEGSLRGLRDLGRRLEVRVALGEVHGAVQGRDPRHLADDGLGELLDPVRHPPIPDRAAVAREMNLSETTFVFPSTNPAAHYRNRIFTPGGEIPFAGHPSIGTAFVAALEGLVPHSDGSSVVYQELEIGVLPLELLCEGGQVKKVIMTQGEP